MIICLIVGLLVSGLGVYVLLAQRRLKRVCTEQVEGVVVEVVRRVETQPDERDEVTSVTYAPIFSYTVNGVEYEKKASVSKSRIKLRKGDKATIFYNPNNPDEYYALEHKGGVTAGMLILIVGGTFLAAAVYGLITELM